MDRKVTLFLLGVISACNSEGGFSSSGNSDASISTSVSTSSTTDAVSSPPGQIDSDPVQKKCEQEGFTNVRLLSPTVSSGKSGNHIDYEISATDCAGKPASSLEGSLSFDIGAETSMGNLGLIFRTIGDDLPQAGTLVIERGRDLFGNTGDQFQYFKSSAPIKLNKLTKAIKIRIEFGGSLIDPYIAEDKKQGTVSTFLRFGDAKPAKNSVRLLKSSGSEDPSS